jgi:hypothetical protein
VPSSITYAENTVCNFQYAFMLFDKNHLQESIIQQPTKSAINQLLVLRELSGYKHEPKASCDDKHDAANVY